MASTVRPCARWANGCAAAASNYKEDIVEGLEQAPRAFIGLLRGENFGKLQVRLGPDPTAR